MPGSHVFKMSSDSLEGHCSRNGVGKKESTIGSEYKNNCSLDLVSANGLIMLIVIGIRHSIQGSHCLILAVI